jgi:hypothetical protein
MLLFISQPPERVNDFETLPNEFSVVPGRSYVRTLDAPRSCGNCRNAADFLDTEILRFLSAPVSDITDSSFWLCMLRIKGYTTRLVSPLAFFSGVSTGLENTRKNS